jgi:hypothetical protein
MRYAGLGRGCDDAWSRRHCAPRAATVVRSARRLHEEGTRDRRLLPLALRYVSRLPSPVSRLPSPVSRLPSSLISRLPSLLSVLLASTTYHVLGYACDHFLRLLHKHQHREDFHDTCARDHQHTHVLLPFSYVPVGCPCCVSSDQMQAPVRGASMRHTP